MTLISSLPKANGTFLKTYRANNGRLTLVWKNEFGTKVASCDQKGNPTTLIDIVMNKITTYIKAKDGSTMIKEGNKVTKYPHIIFNNIAHMFFK